MAVVAASAAALLVTMAAVRSRVAVEGCRRWGDVLSAVAATRAVMAGSTKTTVM
jgi:hypothetical protein